MGPDWLTGLARKGLEEASRTRETSPAGHPYCILAQALREAVRSLVNKLAVFLRRSSPRFCHAMCLLASSLSPQPCVRLSCCLALHALAQTRLLLVCSLFFGLRRPVHNMLSVRTYVRRGSALAPCFLDKAS